MTGMALIILRKAGVVEAAVCIQKNYFGLFFESDIFGDPFGHQQHHRPGKRKTKDIIQEIRLPLNVLYEGGKRDIPIQKNIICHNCTGSGSNSKKNYLCKTCNGSGVRTFLRQFGPGMITKQQAQCDACSGLGESIPDRDLCKLCNGRKVIPSTKLIHLDIEKGLMEGKKVVLRGEASEAPGAVCGDVIFIIREEPHPIFKREGVHLFFEKKVSLVNALTGFKFLITHLDNREILVEIPAGEILTPGETRKIRNEGMPYYTRPYQNGNLFIEFKLKFPKQLTPQQMQTLRGALPDLEAPPIVKDPIIVETASVSEVDLQQPQLNTNMYGNTEDSDEETGGHHTGGQQVRCAQQ